MSVNYNFKLTKEQRTQFKYAFIILLVYCMLLLTYSQVTAFVKQIVIKTHIDAISGMGRFIHGSNIVSDIHNNVYMVQNNIFLLQFKSNENLSKLEPGKKCTVHGYGIRVPFLGLYPQITRVAT